jgi:transcription elongation factor GreA
LTASQLLAYARSEKHEELEQAWEQALKSPGDVETYRDAIVALCDAENAGLALALGTRMVDALIDQGRKEDAIDLGLAIVARGIHSDSFARQILDLIDEQFASAPWFPFAKSESQLDGLSSLTSERFAVFDKVRRYDAGNVIYHSSGWGEGVVEEFRVDTKEILVRFANGRTQDFPLSTALDTFKPLPKDDLRSMRLLALEQLQQMAEEDPSGLIRKTAKMLRGRVNSAELKNELTPVVIPTSKWASWWRKAKAAAAHDPWLQIEGSKARPQFVLRQKPVSLAAEAERSIQQTLSLDEAMEVVREFLARKLDDTAQSVILDLAVTRVDEAIARQASGDEKAPPAASILDAILLLEQNGRQCSASAPEELRTLILRDGTFDPARLGDLRTQEARDHAVEKLPDALGENWADICIEKLLEFPGNDVEGVINALQNVGRAKELVKLWPEVAPYPRRHPVLTYHLCRLYADGVYEGAENLPDGISVGRVLLNLARVLSMEGKGNTPAMRLKSRVSNLLVGRRQVLQKAVDGIPRSDLAAYLAIVERSGDDFPQEVTDAVIRAVARNYPDLTSRPERPWWERADVIYVTKDGLARQREDHRVLVDVKIPDNAKAIEHAASYGDLSENSEWEAAMEEQRNLTGRAQDMSRELEVAKLIEDQEIPDGIVTPGTKIRAIDPITEETRELRILGPWDCIEPDIINYQAPLAAALLGKKVGDEVEVPSATGPRTMRVESVEKLF